MDVFNGNLVGGGAYGADIANAKCVSMPTLAQRIDAAVAQAEDRLAKVKEAREILSSNPDLERLLNIMQASHF